MSRVLVITTSLRARSNSDRLAEELIAGAKDAGHDVEHISLKGRYVKYEPARKPPQTAETRALFFAAG